MIDSRNQLAWANQASRRGKAQCHLSSASQVRYFGYCAKWQRGPQSLGSYVYLAFVPLLRLTARLASELIFAGHCKSGFVGTLPAVQLHGSSSSYASEKIGLGSYFPFQPNVCDLRYSRHSKIIEWLRHFEPVWPPPRAAVASAQPRL